MYHTATFFFIELEKLMFKFNSKLFFTVQITLPLSNWKKKTKTKTNKQNKKQNKTSKQKQQQQQIT